MQCYERYHWTPDDIKRIPKWEAERLSVWFEEVTYHESKKARDIEDSPGSSSTNRTTEEVHIWEETEKDYVDVFEEDF